MLPTIADVANALDREPHPEHRAALEEVAICLLWLRINRREMAQTRALICRLTLDEARAGGDDDQRDTAAA